MQTLTALAAAFVLASGERAGSEGLTTTPVQISTAADTAAELASARRLRELLDLYDADGWIFHGRVLIKDNVLPHSHPVVTLRAGDADREMLANFLHENIHWRLAELETQTAAAVAELRTLYPDLPIRPPEGAGGAHSSYLHLIVCALEHQALREVMGPEPALEIIQYWTTHHYTAIYEIILRDEQAIMAVLERHGVTIPPRPA